MPAPPTHSAENVADVKFGPLNFHLKGAAAKSAPVLLLIVMLSAFAGFGWVLWDRMNKMDAKIDQLVIAIIGDGHGNRHTDTH